MKPFFTFVLLCCFFGAFSQNTLTLHGDSLLYENAPVGIIQSNGFKINVKDLRGNTLITVSEGGYLFNTGKAAWPQKAVLSKEATVATLNEQRVFGKGGLNTASVERFIRRFPVKQSVLPALRTSPRSNEED